MLKNKTKKNNKKRQKKMTTKQRQKKCQKKWQQQQKKKKRKERKKRSVWKGRRSPQEKKNSANPDQTASEEAHWSGSSLFAFLTNILWIPSLITNIRFENEKREKYSKFLELLLYYTIDSDWEI